MSMQPRQIEEQPYTAKEVMALLRIETAATLRNMIKAKRVPAPDIQTSKHHRLWHRATLRAAGILNDQKTLAGQGGAT
jgi:hypothetical protein